jgi:hypothetical protein
MNSDELEHTFDAVSGSHSERVVSEISRKVRRTMGCQCVQDCDYKLIGVRR